MKKEEKLLLSLFSIVPGGITDFSFKRNSSTLTYLVAKPTHLGSDTITIKVDCVDDKLDAEQVFQEDNIENTNHISISPPCIKVAQCSVIKPFL